MSLFPLTIGPPDVSRIDEIAQIAASSALSSLDSLPEFRARAQEVAEAMDLVARAQLADMLVLEASGAYLGYVVVDGAKGEITDLFVHPDHQSKGVGGLLITAAEAKVSANGHSCAWLTTHASNDGALRFYKTHGYALLSVNQAQGETLPDVVYPRALLAKQLKRPNVAAAQSMADVRMGIDTIDPMLVSMIAERFAFIDRAADLKPSLAMPARVADRVEEVVANARAAADSIGFDADLTESLWRTMIDLAIAREETVMGPDRARQDTPDESAA